MRERGNVSEEPCAVVQDAEGCGMPIMWDSGARGCNSASATLSAFSSLAYEVNVVVLC